MLLVSQRRAAVDRFGVLFPSLWLFLLLDPLLEGWARREETRGVLGLVCTVAFAAVYLSLWLCSPEERRRLVRDSPLRWSVGYVGALAALGALCVLLLGEPGIICVVYVSGACVMAFPLRVSAPVVVALGAGTLALGARADWGSQLVTAFGVMAASSAVYGLRAVLIRDRDLVRAHEENARLAVDNERSRFARDLHDILGHSLTVVTVKAELAQKLLDVDVERARAEVADLERLSRDALVDVRRAVEGYREITLPGELVRARVALRAAEIEADLPTTTDDIPSELRELFAWAIREGVTNVIRHSGARHCTVRLTATAAEISDDGPVAPSPNGHGSGLAGLRERAAEAGATVVTRELSPGFLLSVERS